MSIAQAVIKQKIPDHPGPGQYETEKVSTILPKNPSYSIAKSKNQLLKDQHLPGPGFYEVKEVQARLQKSISYTFKKSRPKNQVVDSSNSAYNPNYNISKSSAPAYSIYRNDIPLNKISETPGPGEYIKEVSSTLAKGGVSFPTEMRKYTIEKIPGPGDYKTEEALDRLTYKGPSALMPTAKPNTKRDYLPGPGEYETIISSISRCGGTISKDSRKESADKTPGPGDYVSDSLILKRKNPRYIIGKESKTAMESIREFPGPANYDVGKSYERILAKGPKAVIPRSEQSRKYAETSPGPGSYAQVQTSLSKKGGTIEKSRYKGLLNESINPGPGQYRVSRYSNLYQAKKGHTIGKSKLKNPQNDVTPGPGHYLNEKLTSSLPHIKLKNSRISREFQVREVS